MQSTALIFAPLKRRLSVLPTRERWLIVAGSVFVLGAIVYGLLIAPMQRELEQLRVTVALDREKLAKMRVQAQQVTALKAAVQPGALREGARASIERSAERHGLRAQLKQLQDNGAGVQITLDNVAADALFEWLQDLSASYGIRARSALIQSLAQAGQINASLVLKSSAP